MTTPYGHGEVQAYLPMQGMAQAREFKHLTVARVNDVNDLLQFSGLVVLKFGNDFNESMENISLPPTLRELIFGLRFNQSIEKDKLQLPSGLKQLTFGQDFNQTMVNVALHPGLESLTFGYNFNQRLDLDDVNLHALRSLTFGWKFNTNLDQVKLDRLENLTLGSDFNQTITELPSGLRNLTFGWKFDPKKLKTWPNTLQTLTFSNESKVLSKEYVVQGLTFGYGFNQKVDELPSNLETLTFGWQFNQRLKRYVLPSSLLHLTFGKAFNQKVDHILFPCGLQFLAFGDYFNQSLNGISLPSDLQHLAFGDYFNQSLSEIIFPSGLQRLTFGRAFNQSMERLVFPSGLQRLTFGDNFRQSLDITYLGSLQNLTLGAVPLESMQLPVGLKMLMFSDAFNPLPRELELKGLAFGMAFNSLLGSLPNLQRLTFGKNFDQSLKGINLPECLKRLTFGKYFNQSMEHVDLPIGLERLTFGDFFNQSLETLALPSGLSILTVGREFTRNIANVIEKAPIELMIVRDSRPRKHPKKKHRTPLYSETTESESEPDLNGDIASIRLLGAYSPFPEWVLCVDGIGISDAQSWPPDAVDGDGNSLPVMSRQRRMQDAKERPENVRTSLVLRGMPVEYSFQDLLDLLDRHGFYSKYDFVYLPFNFRHEIPLHLGYAFVNCTSYGAADAMKKELDGKPALRSIAEYNISIDWAPFQGKDDLVECYRNSPIMADNIKPEHRPRVFQDGREIKFPEPTTKRLKKIKIRPNKSQWFGR